MATRRLPTEERRRQIAEVALCILAERGASGLTTAEIARRVGITDGSVFKHFKDKVEIVDAAIAEFEALLASDVATDLDDPLRRLGAFFVRRLAKVRERPEVLRLVFSERLEEAAGSPEAAARVRRVVASSMRFVRECVEDAQRRGMLASDVPGEILVWVVTGVLRGVALAGVSQPVDENSVAAASPERAWEVLEDLLRRTRSPSPDPA